MSKEPRKLNELPENWEAIEIYELWWDERNKVGMMNDKHITNALNKLQGLGKETYEGEPQLRRDWITILRREQIRREDLRKASFNEGKAQSTSTS